MHSHNPGSAERRGADRRLRLWPRAFWEIRIASSGVVHQGATGVSGAQRRSASGHQSLLMTLATPCAPLPATLQLPPHPLRHLTCQFTWVHTLTWVSSLSLALSPSVVKPSPGTFLHGLILALHLSKTANSWSLMLHWKKNKKKLSSPPHLNPP